MTLHEIYATLLRRGMPLCPHLKYAHSTWFILVCKADDPWELVEDDAVAADLLTMHAWRWHGGGKIRVAPEHVLMAILHATKHLEPK